METDTRTTKITWQELLTLPVSDPAGQEITDQEITDPGNSKQVFNRRDSLKLLAVGIGQLILSSCNGNTGNSQTKNNTENSGEFSDVPRNYDNLRRTNKSNIKWLPIVVDKYWEIFISEGKNYGVDPGMTAIIALVESGFYRDALSNKDATSLMQVMPATKELMLKHLTNRGDPIPSDPIELNIKMATLLIRMLTDNYTGKIKSSLNEDRNLNSAEREEVLRKVIWDYHDGARNVSSNYMSAGAQVLVEYVLGMWSEKDKNDSIYFRKIWQAGKVYWIEKEADAQGIILYEESALSKAGKNKDNNTGGSGDESSTKKDEQETKSSEDGKQEAGNKSAEKTEESNPPVQPSGEMEISDEFEDGSRNLYLHRIGKRDLDIYIGDKKYMIEVIEDSDHINPLQLKISKDSNYKDGGGWEGDPQFTDSFEFTIDEGMKFSYRQKEGGGWAWFMVDK
ncbi:MAG: hypothetical protein UV73_C0015G0010 [Candidatus Gottesmanbacteria bacterium GW2011_GWA2_43_14]|uniref:Transglycosylase SLT domain-containing protein n=1 Tax=Candidatus Gottesmanbacteria bacterium GW2011_GWA2_43_14 TaxID=1618443 RepID=A0A0G1DCT6_9BACT|nr:MAG: hypothetical protein UV73_C0015G0010 [Candidatus Gottesmanbacteria bacterium GW2011_GWA2_43_14]